MEIASSSASSAFFQAIKDCRIAKVKFLVDNISTTPVVQVKNPLGQNCLVIALHVDKDGARHKMFKFFLAHSADHKNVDKSGRDVFMWACHLNRAKEANMLLEYGDFNLARKDYHGKTALHLVTLTGNVEFLTNVVRTMAKFGLAVDVSDGEGFTPYLYAKRLGFQACADVLYKEGHASPQQFDTQVFKSSQQWEERGNKERQQIEHFENEKKIATYKTLGRLPQLVKSNFDVNTIKIVPSKVDKKYLNDVHNRSVKGDQRQILQLAIETSGHADLDDDESSTRHKSSNIEALYLPYLMGKHDDENMDSQNNTDIETSPRYLYNVRASLPAILDVMSWQNSTGYVPPATKPKPKLSISTIVSVSTGMVRNARDAKRKSRLESRAGGLSADEFRGSRRSSLDGSRTPLERRPSKKVSDASALNVPIAELAT